MEVAAAMLADSAIEANGKVYIHGGAWDKVTVPGVPTMMNIALVVVFRVEYAEAQTDLPVTIELLDADAQPAGLKGGVTIRTGQSPHAEVGDPATVSLVQSFPLPIMKAAAYTFRVSDDKDGRVLAEVPFRVSVAAA